MKVKDLWLGKMVVIHITTCKSSGSVSPRIFLIINVCVIILDVDNPSDVTGALLKCCRDGMK